MSQDLVPLLFLVAFLVALYFLIIRPQQKRIKEHQSMVEALRRGDTVITAGGIVGKVTKVIDDREAEVEIAENTRVRIIKQTVTDVRSKSEPATKDQAKA